MRAPVGREVFAGRAEVIFHVAAAQHAARIDIFEAGEDFGGGPADGVDHDVQAAAMAHGHDALLGAESRLRVRGSRRAAESAPAVAFERIALGAQIARLQHLLEEFGADQALENALRDRAPALPLPVRWAIQRRRSASGMCMNSAPMVPQ